MSLAEPGGTDHERRPGCDGCSQVAFQCIRQREVDANLSTTEPLMRFVSQRDAQRISAGDDAGVLPEHRIVRPRQSACQFKLI